jgi:two-component system OmpR family response regulator
MRVLLVEDDPMIAQAIKGALADEMYTVEQVANGRDALMMLSLNDYGFVLLDLGLPGVDGMTVLRTLRANAEGNKKTVPVIILTARDGLDDRLEGLDAGADDYLVKPFHISELLARIRAVLRRKNQINENSLTNGVVTLDVVQKTALLASNPTPITLSRREYGLLAALLARPGTILSRRKIEERIYEPGEEPESNAVEYLIHSLRKKLGTNVIKNVRGLGWMVEKGSSQ